MATLRDHINLEIAALKAKLEAVPAELLDKPIAEVHSLWQKISLHFYSEHAQTELAPKPEIEPKPESDKAAS